MMFDRTDGEFSPNAKLTWRDVEKIRDMRKRGAKLSELVKRFGVSKTVISKVCRMERWTETPANDDNRKKVVIKCQSKASVPKPVEPKPSRGKITPSAGRIIEAMNRKGFTQQEIAKELGLQKTAIGNYLRKRKAEMQ